MAELFDIPITDYYDGGKRRLSETAHRYRLRLARSPAPLEATRAVQSLPDDPSILFLCLGNICRSPMADRYLRRRADEVGLDGVTVSSVGFIPREDRPSPDVAVDVAREYGVDLSDHRSTAVTDDHVRNSDAIFLMDVSNFRAFRDRFGDRADAYFLGQFGDDGSNGFEIGDPYSGGEAEFRRTYDEVTCAVDALLAAYRREERGDSDDQ